MEGANVRERLLAIIEPLVMDEGFELVDLQLGGGQRRPTLQVLVDRAEGVSIDDCARISRYLSPTLDGEDVMPGAYVLEVSSPGVERPLRTVDHFRRALEHTITVVAEGVGFVRGRLAEVGDEAIVVIDEGDRERPILLADITRAKLWVSEDELFGRGKKKGSSR